MADQSKPKSTFSFGQPGQGLFGSQTTSASTSGGFPASNAAAPASTGGGFFGSLTAPRAPESKSFPTTGLFGASGGGKSDQPTTAGSTLFGQPSTGNVASGIKAGQPTAGAPSGSVFSTPSKPSDAGTSSSTLFGAAPAGSGLFGSKTLTDMNATTPTSKPTTSLFGNSTTPAGPPPAASTGGGTGSVFSFSKSEAPSSFSLGGTQAPSTKPSTPSLFQSLGNPSVGSTEASSTKPPTASLFQSLGNPSANTPQQQGSQAPQAPNLFGNPLTTGNDTSGNLQTSQPQGTASQSTNDNKSAPTLFSNASAPSPFSSASNQPQTSTAPKANPFGLFAGSNANASSGASAVTSDGQKTSTAPGISNLQSQAANTTSTSASAPSAPAASTSSVFGSLGKMAPPASDSQSQNPPKIAATDASKLSTPNLGASTTGPMPLARSRLKDKTMDDIITRWASDLSRYQKEFQTQAEKVASWDRVLVENSEKIQRLYGSTLEAERATTEVERQLTSVESDQAELESWLNHYEAEVDNMIQSQVGKNEGFTGPDQERERTYQLATRLSDRLDDMGKDLSSMIEEINDASSNLTKHTKSDDPLTQVVRVLNGHLTQLQQIDQGAASLQLKVKEAQRAGQNIRPSHGLNGPSSEAAESFYRSFMGR